MIRKETTGKMAETSALADFKQGIKLLRNGHSADAVEYLRNAAELELTKPVLPLLSGGLRCPRPAAVGTSNEILRDGPKFETQ